MDKLSNYIKDYDNIASVINDDEYKYCNRMPILPPQLLDGGDEAQKFLVRIKTDDISTPNYIELASNLDVKQIVTTDTVTGFVTTSGEFFMLYDGIQYFEKITNHINYAIAGESIFCLVTNKNIPIFVSTCNGQVIDDDFWLNQQIKTIYNIKNKFYFITESNSLYIFDGCVKMGFTFEEIDNQIQDMILTLDTITVLTIHGQVWLFGDKEHGAYITDGRGFIPGINSAKQVVRTVRAGAILTEDNSVWAWGNVLYGGSPRPGWVKGLKDNCKRLLSTSTSIIVITHANQLWAWSNEWFKTYSLPESEYAIASCINKSFNHFKSIKANKTSWIIHTRDDQYFILGRNMKQLRFPRIPGIEPEIIKLDYGWFIVNNKVGLLYTDIEVEKYTNVFHVSHLANKLIIQSLHKIDMISINHIGKIHTIINHIPSDIFTSYISDKHGFMYITNDCCVYHNTNLVYKNIDSQFSIGIVNYKEIVLYIQYAIEDRKTVKIQEKPIEITCPPCVQTPAKTTPPTLTPTKTPAKTIQPTKTPTKTIQPTKTPAKTLPLTQTRTPAKTTSPPPTPTPTPTPTPIVKNTNVKTPLIQIQPMPVDLGVGKNSITPKINTPMIQIQPMPVDLGIGKNSITPQQQIKTPIIENMTQAVKKLFTLDFIQQNIDINIFNFVLFIIITFVIFIMIVKLASKS